MSHVLGSLAVAHSALVAAVCGAARAAAGGGSLVGVGLLLLLQPDCDVERSANRREPVT